MIPIVTPEEMAAIDAAAPEPVEVLIERAGRAVAQAALEMLGGTYGRRIVVLAGKGNNGNDGRVAAAMLAHRGVRVSVVEASEELEALPEADLVIDAAYGTGLRGAYHPPHTSAPVLAVDIPSGVNGVTGEVAGSVLAVERTVTFAALKPGLLLQPGAAFAGEIEIADIGLDVSGARSFHVTDDAVRAALPSRADNAHKWQSACWIIAGSAGMSGAAKLAAAAAQRIGAGYVRLSTPGGDPDGPTESVGFPLPLDLWNRDVTLALDRISAVGVGPGLGRSNATIQAVRNLISGTTVPLVIDGDGLYALGDKAAEVLAGRGGPTILTPHDGEYTRLAGRPPMADRIGAARELAATLRAYVVLKGPATVTAMPGGQTVVTTSGDARLATAGTGDVLTGMIVGLLAQGLEPVVAAGSATHLHGLAGRAAPRRGLVASDLVDELPAVLADLESVR